MANKHFTLRQLAADFEPAWERLEDWLAWPPDVFLLTSTVLKSTGAYRYVVSPPGEPWPEARDWFGEVQKAASEWRDWMVTPGNSMPEFLNRCRSDIEATWDQIELSSLRSISSGEDRDPSPWLLCKALLELHAVADEACRGFGLPSGSYSRSKPECRSEMSAIDYLANMLLVMTGSLSRLPRTFGFVLPKMRTPQVGLTLRSFSHHVTFHQSEVEVRWRTMPWINIDENTINIMIVPWPEEMKSYWFRPEHHFVRRNSSEPARYFAYDRGKDEMPIERVLSLLEQAKKSVTRVHMIVFPELALTERELQKLQDELARRLARDSMPMIIAGLCDPPSAQPQDGLGSNRVVLSTFFAGKWYDLYQNKHHRWKLDSAQVRQYRLGGVLTGGNDWWEAIEVHERRLTFMAPNGWLDLCPLICEDLARLEPISDLIRGVGPTLLIAILLDGPQLRERWPGRYAGVLADDPGTSVLTASSLGMAKQSIPQSRRRMTGNVALWKDQINGWSDIKLEDRQEAAVITLSASWTEEFAADGRGDDKSAAVLALQGMFGLAGDGMTPADEHAAESKEWEPDFYETTRRLQHSDGATTAANPKDEDKHIDELTTFAYLVDAALDSSARIVKNLQCWAVGERSVDDWLESDFRAKGSVWERIAERNGNKLTEEFRVLVRWLGDLLRRIHQTKEPGRDLTPYWEVLVQEAGGILANARQESFRENLTAGDSLDAALDEGFPVHEALRIQIYTALSILWAVHRRLSRERRSVGLTYSTATLLYKIEKLLPGKYDKEWYRAKAEWQKERTAQGR